MVTITSIVRLTLITMLFIVAWLPKPSVKCLDKPLVINANVANIRVEYGVMWKYAYHNMAIVSAGTHSTPILDESLGIGVLNYEPIGLLKSILLTVIGSLLIIKGEPVWQSKKTTP